MTVLCTRGPRRGAAAFLAALAVSIATPRAAAVQQDALPQRVPSPYHFSAATALLEAELPNLSGRVAVVVRQGGREHFRFQAGSIDYDTRTRLASFTKTISAGVILDLVEDGVLALDERLGDAYPMLFEANGLGDPTVLDCWAMRHGIETFGEFHRDRNLTHLQSVLLIGTQGFEVFRPGTQLGYDGCGMQVVGMMAAQRTGLDWESLARVRLFDPLDMPQADYQQFAPNPAVAGGLRSTAVETMRFAEMVMADGMFRGERILEPSSIEELFTNRTRDLPVYGSPFPPSHPDYPYGVDPDYGFGGWVLAEHPTTQHVEEVVGAGAWGSFLWLDRRRGLSAVLITDVPPGTQRSMDAALGLFTVARAAVEAKQVSSVAAGTPAGGAVELTWTAPAGARFARVYGAQEPIRDVFDLRAADRVGRSSAGRLDVPPYPYYAVTADFRGFENEALVPGGNAIAR
ncbi:MAG: serine hydrolase domain-containing protein [Planctomycetota bacterium]